MWSTLRLSNGILEATKHSWSIGTVSTTKWYGTDLYSFWAKWGSYSSSDQACVASLLTTNLAHACKKAPKSFFYTIQFKYGFPGNHQTTKLYMATVLSKWTRLKIKCASALKDHILFSLSQQHSWSPQTSQTMGAIYLDMYNRQSTVVLAGLHPWSCPSSCLLYNNDRSFLDLWRLVPSLTEAMSYLVFCALTKSRFRVFHQYFQ